MATDVPQRDLRNRTAEVLRRVQRGERLRITVHGHPVAELGPVGAGATFISRAELIRDFKGLLLPDDDLERQLREADEQPRDPFA
jgi:prevent-host-death family protein